LLTGRFDTFAHNFLIILKNIKLASEIIEYVAPERVDQVLNKTTQKPSAMLSNKGPMASEKGGGLEATT